MSDYTLSADVLGQLEEVAGDDQRSVTDVLNEIVKEYLARRHDEKISQESERFRTMHSQLYAKYTGQYVAMRDGKVLDHDADVAILHQRIYKRFGHAPILIAPVTAEPLPEFRIRRPRLELMP
jgi:hypothetical protein